MTGGVAGSLTDRRPDPMVSLQRRAFGLSGPGTPIQLAAAVAGPAGALALCWDRVVLIALAAAVLVPMPVLLALLAVRSRSRWPAQEVLAWLDLVAATEWRTQTGSRMPRNSVQADEWLRRHAETEVPPAAWISALLMAGRPDEARPRIDALPGSTAAQLHSRLDFELAADAAGGRAIDISAVDDAAGRDTAADPAARVVHLAYHASVAAASRGIDGLPSLAAARPALGRLPAALTPRLALLRFRYAAVSASFGAWLLAATLIGLATAGGVVWF